MGAFDECLETAVRDRDGNVLSRGQYCNLLVYANNATATQAIMKSVSEAMHPKLAYFSKRGAPADYPIARLALCYIDDCNQHDLQAMVNAARAVNLLESKAKWHAMFVAAAFNGVDTFLFLRLCVPLFFVIMCFYLLPRFVDGPDTETFFQRFHADVSEHWWMLLVQIRNFYELNQQVLGHLWYLSTDFQLFVVSLMTLLIFRRRKPAALAALAMLSLLGNAIATWTMARLHLLPFLVMPFPHFLRMVSTVNNYYTKPFYHSVCFFSGCMTCLIVANFRERKISKTLELAGWCVSVSCGFFCVFVKFPWFLEENPTTTDVEITVAFFDRMLWSICLVWITLACSTGRGGEKALPFLFVACKSKIADIDQMWLE
ncbi:hypothetical protein MTO96_019756 [Rhipicephalus appendiculatus]